MRQTIEPRYEILFNDLKEHSIGDYLVSRDFKIRMSTNDYYEAWQKTYQNVKNNRTILSVGYNHEKGDSVDTLMIYLNASHEVTNVDNIITLIIIGFIESKKTNEDFSNIIEAMNISKYSNNLIEKVSESFEKHKSLKLPEKQAKTPSNTNNSRPSSIKKNKKEIFIVHGHNETLKEKVARTIQNLKLTPIILHEQSNQGLTIIEKFEKHSNVDFAIILLTNDDYGNCNSSEIKNKRARQNVILELGYFIGKIGRSNVLPLYESEVELPSDISGVIYTEIDKNDSWKYRLVKELRAAGYDVNANDIL